jgi:hypothetical protein
MSACLNHKTYVLFQLLQVHFYKRHSTHQVNMDPNPQYHQFSWLTEPVNVRNECQFCLIFKNSPCESVFNKFEQANEKQMKSEGNERAKKQADRLWDKVMECVKTHPNVFSAREAERNEFVKKMRNR